MGGRVIGIIKRALHIDRAGGDHGCVFQAAVKNFKYVGLVRLFATHQTHITRFNN